MAILFYNEKKKKKVLVNEVECIKVRYECETKQGPQVRYAFLAQDDDGMTLTTFCSQADWNAAAIKM